MKNNLKKFAAGALILTSALTAASAWPWSKSGFNNKKTISVLSREEGSGTRGAFVELFKIEKKDASGKKVDYTTDEAAITNSTAVMLTSVAGDKYAIGYVSLGSLNSSVKALKIDGAQANVANINNGSYKVSRPFNIAVKDNLSEVARDFLGYVFSAEGQKIVEKNKYIPVPSKDYKSNQPAGKVVVSGSSSVSPVMEKIIEAYKSVNPNAKVELQTSDSSTGVKNAISGSCDIGMASRALKDSELSQGVKGMVMAIDGIAVVVNNENPTDNLSKAQVEAIFTGKVSKWNKIN
ncbi:MAG: substrate-binding domain-containing protein [Treponema sp.]|nr:substrate-binding domain-containing protein [Treponema sp.]